MSRDLHKRRKATDIAVVRTPQPEPVAPTQHLAAPANAPLTAAPAASVQEAVAPPETATLAYDFGSMRVFPDQHASAPTPPPAAPAAPPALPSGPDQGSGTAAPARLSFPIQASLRINPPDDVYEQEAEQVAKAVTHDSDGPGAVESTPDIASLYVQRSSFAPGLSVSPSVEANIARMQRGGGQQLSAADQTFFGQRFGHDFSQIRIHHDPAAAETSRSINARAFTVGNHIAFDTGEYQPGTEGGRHLLAHELTHTIQQTGGVATKRADKPRAGHHFGAIQLYPSTPAVQREPAADEGVCPVCGKVGTGTCPDCGQPFMPVQRSLRPGADPLTIQRKAGPDLEDELRRALEQRGGEQQVAGAAQGDLSALNGAGGGDATAAAEVAPDAMQALREGRLPGVGSTAGDAASSAGAAAPAGAAAGLTDDAASAGAPAAVGQATSATEAATQAQPAAQPPEAAQAAQSIADAAAQPAEAAAQPAAEVPAAPAAQALPETQPAQADGSVATAAAEDAAALLDSVEADFQLPEEQPEVAAPPSAEPVDAGGMPLPGDADMEAQIAELASQAQELREQGNNLRAQAAEQRSNAGILRGNAQLIQSHLAASESGVKTAEGHVAVRRDALGQARQALFVSEKKAEVVGAKGQESVQRSDQGLERSGPMTSEARQVAAESSTHSADDPEANQNAQEQSSKLRQVSTDSQEIDSTLHQVEAGSNQLVQDAARATQMNSQTSGKLDTVETSLGQSDKRIAEMHQQNAAARDQIAALSDGPQTMLTGAAALDAQGQELIQQSMELEARLSEMQLSYLDGMRQVPAAVPHSTENTPPEELAALATEAGVQTEALAPEGLGEADSHAGLPVPADEMGEDMALDGAETITGAMEDSAFGTDLEVAAEEDAGAFGEADVAAEDEDAQTADSESLVISRQVKDPPADDQIVTRVPVPAGPSEEPRAIPEKTDKPIDLTEGLPEWLTGLPPVNEEERQAMREQEEQRRRATLDTLLAKKNKSFDQLGYWDKQALALELTGKDLFGGMGKIAWPNMRDLAVSLIDPRASLTGVLKGMSQIGNAFATFAKEPSWGGALKLAANVATGLTVVLGSITLLAGLITSILMAATVLTLGLGAIVTGPLLAFCASVMITVGGWTFSVGLIAAALNALMFAIDLHKAGTAETADELLEHSRGMTDDAKQAGESLLYAGLGKLSQIGGKGLLTGKGSTTATRHFARKGADSWLGQTVKGVKSQGLGGFAKSTLVTAKQQVVGLPKQIWNGLKATGRNMQNKVTSAPAAIGRGIVNAPAATFNSVTGTAKQFVKGFKNTSRFTNAALKNPGAAMKRVLQTPSRLRKHLSESWKGVKEETDDIFGWYSKGANKSAPAGAGPLLPQVLTEAERKLLGPGVEAGGSRTLRQGGRGAGAGQQTADELAGKTDISSIGPQLGKSVEDKIVLKSNSVVIDTQTAIALEKQSLGKELQEGEKAMVKRISEMGDVDLVMSDQATKEFANKTLDWNGKPVRKGMSMKINPDDEEFRSLLNELENNNVGQGKGSGDRQIVAETFFAPTESGVTPTLVTHDPGIYNKLWKISSGKEPHPRHFGGKSLTEALADGFDVTINGRTIRVIPIPKK